MKPGIRWTAEVDAILLASFARGRSFDETAADLAKHGYNVTRNAVAGRGHRLKVKGLPVMKPLAIRKGRPKGSKAAVLIKRPVSVPPTPPVAHLDDASIEGVEYLKNEGCKAILDRYGDDSLPLCCGRPRTHDGFGNLKSYCAEHQARYTSSIPNRSKQYG